MFSKGKKRPFNANGAEGMLDVVLGCTLIFLLLTALVKVESGTTQELTLPDMDLTKATGPKKAGGAQIKRSIISIRKAEAGVKLWLDDQDIALDSLKQELERLGPGAHVALRRDRSLPCSVEDEVILACREAGIERVAIMIQEKDKNQ